VPFDKCPKIRWGYIKAHKNWEEGTRFATDSRCIKLNILHSNLSNDEIYIEVEGKSLDEKEKDYLYIHDSALLGYYARIGLGCEISKGVILAEGTFIKRYGKVGENVSVGMNSEMGDWVNIRKNTIIENDVTIGEHVTIGSNTVVKTGCTIGDYCSVGNDVVLRNQLTHLKGSVYMVYLYSPEKREIGIFDQIYTIKHWKKYYKNIFRSRNFGFGEDQIIEYKRYIDLFDRILST
jgi:NDP-sugar pyrophosphorylase family protein